MGIKDEDGVRGVPGAAAGTANAGTAPTGTPPTGTPPVGTVQLFGHLAPKTAEALATFTELKQCHYANKRLGNSNQDEQMTCDCVELVRGGVNVACGRESDCINRLTSVECVDGECTCGEQCQNQRFQRREYAAVTVIQTEKKGYGLRADQDIEADAFVYEYIGDVIDEQAFRERMVKYDQRGLKHFYFMMLQKNEFIDATARGCLARFCNHSCRPNAFVDKWVVGNKLKMGIFSKRRILKGEEITFDYNVDRYGAQAQPCYCGETNCIGFMGGKTQTESASLLPQIVAEALGVTPAQEKDWLRMMKASGRRIKKEEDSNINEEFIASLQMQPLATEEVSKAMSALLRSQEAVISRKVVERIWLTNDKAVHTRVIRMHGYEIFSTLIRDNWQDAAARGLLVHILEILSKWPKMTRNKISSSKIEPVLRDVLAAARHGDRADEQVASLASGLLDAWSTLEMAYRIPKRSEAAAVPVKSESVEPAPAEAATAAAAAALPPSKVHDGVPLPAGWEWATAPDSDRVYFYNRTLNVTQWSKPVEEPVAEVSPQPPQPQSAGDSSTGFSLKRARDDDDDDDDDVNGKRSGATANAVPAAVIPTKPAGFDKSEREAREKARLQREIQESEKNRQLRELEYQRREEEARRKVDDLNSIILKAQQDAEARRVAEQRLQEQEAELKRVKAQRASSRREAKAHRTSHRPPVQSAREKALKKLFASVVPNMIKKFESEIGHDNVKQCAKEIVNLLTEKELRRHADVETKELTDEKRGKVKHFARAYMDKFLVKYRAKEARKAGA